MTSFDKAILRQIEVNQARTPTERFLALCDLLDLAREMAPKDAESVARRRRAIAARERDREAWRARYRQFIAQWRQDASTGI